MTRVLSPLAAAVTVLGFWWWAVEAFRVRPFFLPSPPDILDAYLREPHYLLTELGRTLSVTTAGFVIAAVAGIALAILLTTWRPVEHAVLPLLVALNAVPKAAVAPLLVVWLGFGASPKIVLVVLISFFPIALASAAGLTATPVELTELSRSLDASRWQTYAKVRLPWALPQIFVGLKVAVSLAVIGAVVAEIANPDQGLGAVIVLSSASADTPMAFAAIVLLALTSVSLFYTIVLAERLMLPWARDITG
ncbi:MULTISPECIES: ABC transporter permease [Catenuloplanes]|uniref:NitT/TauT family transport system permease protein n=1 Tax=Catenuloplanes niger TaxID=587534 RepID=A0AAE4CU64_9ACTN|nr:ABC transporter permease [Catenuloplanes niger]MDR7321434.1 NitT/TauT family transport system permease protein [Catenuloplanes niger]